MPVMGGLAAAKALTQLLPPESRPYLIALTGNTNSDVREQTKQAGFNFYMSKPADVRTLLSIVERIDGKT